MKKTIVIITSGQPSANPRVVKEATALAEAGYTVTVVYAPLSPWADEFDKRLFAATPRIQWIQAGYSPIRQPILYKYARLRRKGYEWLFLHCPTLIRSYEKAYVLFSQELQQKASKIKADLYIGHNLGALPVAVKVALRNDALAAFDAEDYHRGESDPSSVHFALARNIEEGFIPRLSYMTAASPLIAEKYRELFQGVKITTLNNVFSKTHLQTVNPAADPASGLRLFWFSQTAGPDRGLETVVEALNLLTHYDLSLTILGNATEEYKNQLVGLAAKPAAIRFIPPVELDEIFKIAAGFEIGLLTELPYRENRELCLTNKLFSYLLSGNCIIASNTRAQEQFFAQNSGAGLIFRSGDAKDLAGKMEKLYLDREGVQACRQTSRRLAETTFNWEKETTRLLSAIENLSTKQA